MVERRLFVAIAFAVLIVVGTALALVFYPPSSTSTSHEGTSIASSSQPAENSTSSLSTVSATAQSNASTTASMITVVTAKLVAGSATNATSQGTASMQVVLSNSGPETTITSISIVRVPAVVRPQIFQCSSPESCSPISSPIVGGSTDTNFTSPTRAFFLGATVTANVPYGYVIDFASGASVRGTLNATSGP